MQLTPDLHPSRPRDSFLRIGYLPLRAQKRESSMADHKHGSMDTKVQEKTFAGFIRMVTWGAAISIGILIFMALANS